MNTLYQNKIVNYCIIRSIYVWFLADMRFYILIWSNSSFYGFISFDKITFMICYDLMTSYLFMNHGIP